MSMDGHTKFEHVSMAVAGVMAYVSHITASDWITFLTLCYIIMQITVLMPTYIRTIKAYFGHLIKVRRGKNSK